MTDEDKFYKTAYAYELDKRPFELRFLAGFKYGIRSGYFNDLNLAYQAIKDYWNRYTCYFTLQKINPSIVARCENCLMQTKHTTGDADVIEYRYLHLDADPCRPAGIQSTKEESQYAIDKIKVINKFLKEEYGFSSPVMSFSGNGATLDYRIGPLKVNEENKKLMKNTLKVLDILFSDDKVTIDTSVHNPSRIIKLAGTISAKGSNTEDRPYRMSKVIRIPNEEEKAVSKKQLSEISGMLKELQDE